MADDQEAAERRQLINEINRLESRINRARIEQANLEEELAYLIAAIGVLTGEASKMSQVVNRDVNALATEVEHGELDARDLLQQLRDLSDKYFTYKSLSTATRNLTQYNDEYYTRFSFYHELRRIALGCIMAVDTNLISFEATRTQVERAYLANTDYWLAYAVAAVMLWVADEREAAERALRRALMMDDRKSALLFLFCNLKFGRKEIAARWYSYYLGSIHANDVGPEYQYLLEAYLCGSLQETRRLEAEVGRRFEDMFSEIPLYRINYGKDVADYATNYLETQAHASQFPFFYLATYCNDIGRMRYLINSAEKNALEAEALANYAQGRSEDLDTDGRLETTIYNLIESMDPEEEKVYRQIKYNELIVAARGDVAMARRAYAERYPERGPVSLGDLLEQWAFAGDDPRVLPEVRNFAFGRLAAHIRNGFNQYAELYRAEDRERFEIALGDWEFTCNENETDIAQANYNEFFDKHRLVNYLNDTFIRIWLAMIAAGVIGLIISAATGPQASIIVICVLLVLIGGFLLWQQIEAVKAAREARRRKDLEIIAHTLTEMGEWRAAFRQADAGIDTLIQATYLFEK